MRRRFSEEFKRDAVAGLQNDESQLLVAHRLGINRKTLN